MKEYTREELISICENAFVNQIKWRNRDSAQSQIGLGCCLALLKTDCKFEVQYNNGGCSTNEKTIWIQFWVKDFSWFEHDDGENPDGYCGHDYHFYIPTRKRLEDSKGQDWY